MKGKSVLKEYITHKFYTYCKINVIHDLIYKLKKSSHFIYLASAAILSIKNHKTAVFT